jgi:arylsulfatase
VIFTSDTGPWQNFVNHAGSTSGLREAKGTTFEGGNRVPFIAQWNGHIQGGKINNGLSSNIDLLPTICAITNSKLPVKKIDGVNVISLLKDEEKAEPRKEFLYYYRKNNLEAVRKGQWKLVLAHPGRTYEGFMPGQDGFPGKGREDFPFPEALYDLRRDPGERYDVQSLYPAVVADLKQLAEKAREELGDDLTQRKGTGNRAAGQ